MFIKRRKSAALNREDGLLSFVMLLFLSGCAAGSIFISSLSPELAENYFIGGGFTLSDRVSFFGSFMSAAMLILLLLVSGLCVIGQPAAFCTAVYRGASIGCAVGATYLTHGMKSLPLVLVLDIPHAVATTVILAYGVREAVRFSNLLASCCVSERTEYGFKAGFRKYLLRFMVLLVLAALCAAARTLLFALFYKPLTAL